MLHSSNWNNYADSEKELRIGIWIPHTFNSYENLVNLIKQQEVIQTGDSELFTNNCDNLIPDVAYKLLCKYNNVCLVTTNFPYFTHVDLSFSNKSRDTVESRGIDISPIRFFSPISSPKLDECVEDFNDISSMSLVVVFIVVFKQDLKSKSIDSLKLHVSDIIESFKLFQHGIKFILVMHGIRDLALGSPGEFGNKPKTHARGSSDYLQVSMVNELSSYLLVHHDVDMIETDDDSDLANLIALSSKSIRYSFSKRMRSKFKSKSTQSIKDDNEITNKMWLSQILQLPNFGKNEAITIANQYTKPSEVIESIVKFESKATESKSKRTEFKVRGLGKSGSKRLTKLYSEILVPEDTL